MRHLISSSLSRRGCAWTKSKPGFARESFLSRSYPVLKRAPASPSRARQRQRPGWHRRRLDERGRRRAVEEEAVEEAIELVHRREVNFENEAVLAGDAVALDDFGDLPGEFGDPGELA